MGSTGGVHLLRDVETQKYLKTVVFWLKITPKNHETPLGRRTLKIYTDDDIIEKTFYIWKEGTTW